ncbi:MAG: hypothetical protein PUC59_04045 [Firmicutes bacterium]|nr:hypothetical protein [Bacillota bacterium]
MELFFLFLVMAMIVEGLVEYAKTVIAMQDKKAAVIQLSALSVSVLLCLLSGADVLAPLGVTFRVPHAGEILTGVFASRGANYASDLIGKLNAAGSGRSETQPKP